ncbi:hypothetical protein P4H66_18800 [Paenibacillus dokdonensis]|uniref:Uncharacterized protein n=1 Tax=Paenibacillus dokdonensis TaxID=2567944 RepID=A0ABU6GT54_9BACL|nr:hypothetical protein [Paenibacillus dokdonensis]MEC0241870.1 hypothetical protein [Paenibacillus dokdonensis]
MMVRKKLSREGQLFCVVRYPVAGRSHLYSWAALRGKTLLRPLRFFVIVRPLRWSHDL